MGSIASLSEKDKTGVKSLVASLPGSNIGPSGYTGSEVYNRFIDWLPTTEAPKDPGAPPAASDGGAAAANAAGQAARRKLTNGGIRSTFLSGPRGDANKRLGPAPWLYGGKS